MDWPAERIERWSIDRLTPYARNARTHSDQQIAQIADSIREYGWTMPVLVNERGDIIAGHARVLAAQTLNIIEAPVVVARGWTDEKRRAYVLADNRIALNSAWDNEVLALELGELCELGVDLSSLGFASDELTALLGGDNARGDRVPEIPDAPVSKRGDLWIMGPHRLLCGDSTCVVDVERLVGANQAALCFTSPPYLRQRDYGAAKDFDWDDLMQRACSVLPMSPRGQVLVNLGMIHRDGEWIPYWDGWIQWMRDRGWRRFGWYVWDQGPGLPGDWSGRLAPSHEFIFHFNRESPAVRKTRTKRQESIAPKGGTGIRRANGRMSGISSPAAMAIDEHSIPATLAASRTIRSLGSRRSICFSISCRKFDGIPFSTAESSTRKFQPPFSSTIIFWSIKYSTTLTMKSGLPSVRR